MPDENVNNSNQADVRIKYTYASADEIPDVSVKDLFTEKGGKFILGNVDGVKPIDEYKKVYQEAKELRNKQKELEDTVSMFGDITPEQVAELKEQLKVYESRANETKDTTEVNKLAREIANSEAKEFNKKIAALEAALSERETILSTYKQKDIDRALEDKLRDVSKGKINPEVFDDIVLNAKKDGLTYDEVESDFFHGPSARNTERWFNDKLETKNYWKPWSEAGGASGGNGFGGKQQLDLNDIVANVIKRR